MTFGLVLGQPGGKNPATLPLFSLRSSPVYTGEFIYLYKKNHLKQEDYTGPRVLQYLDLFINFKLKVREARERGIDTTVAFTKEFNSYKEELKKPYLAGKDELDRLTKEAYQHLTVEVKVSHILISLKPEATPADTLKAFSELMTIRSRIISGEDFEKTAKAVSEDPSAKINDGNVGYFTALQMVYPFEQAAYSLKVGELSQPVRTRFGYHLLKVTDRRPARGEVEVSHILLRTSSGNDLKMKNKIHEIFDQLQGGRTWDELCKEYSDDQATRDSGGRLRPFGVGALAGVPEFEAIAFSLQEPGDVSDPFQSAYGWHIIRLEKKIPLPPYGALETSLKQKVSRDERLQIADRKVMEEKRKQLGFTEEQSVKEWFVNAADTALQKGKWKFRGEESFRVTTLFTLQNFPGKAGDFILFIEKNQQPTTLAPGIYMQQLYDRFVEDRIDQIDEARLMTENHEFRNLLNEYREGILLFTIMEKEVWSCASEDTSGLKKYFGINRDKYKAGERVRAGIFSTTSKEFLEEVKKKVIAGDTLTGDDRKKFKSIHSARNYERGENKAVDKVTWAIGLYDVEVDETYYLVEIENLLPPGIKSFEEARALVVADYQDELEKKWVAELKQKFPVKINNKGKKFVVTELTRK